MDIEFHSGTGAVVIGKFQVLVRLQIELCPQFGMLPDLFIPVNQLRKKQGYKEKERAI